MTMNPTSRLLLAVAIATALAGCASTPVPQIARNPDAGTLPTIARTAGGEVIGGPSSAPEAFLAAVVAEAERGGLSESFPTRCGR